MRALIVILGVSALLKLALLWPAAGLPLRGDERQYVAGAIAISETGVPAYPNPVWDEAHSSPLYPYGLAAFHGMFGEETFLTWVRVAQVLLSVLTTLLVYAVALRVFDRRNALISAAIVSVFPTFVAYTHYLLTETVYTFLFVGLAALLLAPPRPTTPGRALAAGVVGGLAALARGAFVVQAPFVLLWLLWPGGGGRRRRAFNAGAFLLGMAVAIGPWSVYSTLRYDRFLLIDTNGGNVLYKNWNVIRQENHDVGMDKRWRDDKLAYEGRIPFRERVEVEHIVERSGAETRAAVRFVLAHPLLFARNSVIRAAELVNPTSFLVRSIRRGDYAGLPTLLGEALIWVGLLGTMALLGFGALGLAGRPPTVERMLPGLMILGNVAVCVLIVSMSRYRYPMLLLVVPFAVDGALRLRQAAGERTCGWWLSLLVVALMAVAWILYVPYSL